MKKLSLIIPTYKKPRSLGRMIESCRRCTNPQDTEWVVVVDDGSFVEVRDRYPGCKVVECGNGSGAGMAIWKGALVSEGEIIGVAGDAMELLTPDTDWKIWSALRNKAAICGLNDGMQQGRAHPFIPRDMWFGGLGYPPCYRHYYGDTEVYRIAKHHHAWIHLTAVPVKHHHEYPKSKGFDVDILEDVSAESKQMAKHDGEIFQRRMKWWEENGKPRMIPWHII